MKAKQVPLTPVLAVGLVILLAVVYMGLLRPKASDASKLDLEIAKLESTVAIRTQQGNVGAAPAVQIDVADIFRLAKAMPSSEDMPGIILELNAVADSAGVRFVSIQPSEAVSKGEYSAVPINLTFEGNYYDLTDFLFRLRNLVTVKEGVLEATGRLYTLDVLDLHEQPTDHFPKIQAVLTISAYSFGAPPVAAGVTPATTTAPETTAPEGTTATPTTETTTGPVTTEPAPAAGAAATAGTGG
jgi:Tfp pilus assembly protein PilO